VISTNNSNFTTKTKERTVEKELKEIKHKKKETDRKENMKIKHKKGKDRKENMEIQRTTLVKNLHRELFNFVGATRSKNTGRHSSRFH
jgi:hypothetical protein